MDRMRSKLFCANPSYFVEKIWRHAQKYVLYAGVPRFTVDFLGSFLYYSFQENSYFAFRKLGTIYETCKRYADHTIWQRVLHASGVIGGRPI